MYVMMSQILIHNDIGYLHEIYAYMFVSGRSIVIATIAEPSQYLIEGRGYLTHRDHGDFILREVWCYSDELLLR